MNSRNWQAPIDFSDIDDAAGRWPSWVTQEPRPLPESAHIGFISTRMTKEEADALLKPPVSSVTKSL